MAKNWRYKTPGIPDESFNQNDKVPGPTKEEIRVISIAKARLNENNVVLDVGCGTGGLTVEAALQVGSKGKVSAIDEEEEAGALTKSNVQKFGVENTVTVSKAKAPEGLQSLPNADAVFIGGGGANLRTIIQTAHCKLKFTGRIVINAILLETATTAVTELKALGYTDIDVVNISVAKGRQVPSGTMMIARNPTTVISATKL